MFQFSRLWPKSPSDRVAYVFALSGIHVVGFFELLVILPFIDRDGFGTYWLHVVMGLFIYFNVITSFFMLFKVDSTTKGVVLPTLIPGGGEWRYCSSCGTTAPPRSFHCWICDMCVLRRDHHCTFTGNCVGHQNQRYFLTLLLYLTIGAAYCNYLNMDYTIDALGGQLSFRAVLTMLLPLLAWTLGMSGAYTFAVSFVSAMCIVGFILFTVLIVYHGRNLCFGQTCAEASMGKREYDLGFKENIRQVLGCRWHLAWLCPFISSPLPGDGLEFRSRYKHHDTIKDM